MTKALHNQIDFQHAQSINLLHKTINYRHQLPDILILRKYNFLEKISMSK